MIRVACTAFVLASFFFAAGVRSEEIVKSSGADQSAVSLTVYNSNVGLVREVRRLTLPSGTGELRFMDVPSGIIPETVLAHSLTSADSFKVLEQNYEYDLINRRRLLDKYVGRRLKIVPFDQAQGKGDPVAATLISNNDGEIYDINGEIFLGHPGVAVLPDIPDNLIAKPTLMWLFANETREPQDIEVAYMTNNITWRADYVLSLDKEDRLGDLAGWVTINNQSGAAYTDARLKLVAGTLNRVQENPRSNMEKMRAVAFDAELAGSGFQEESFFEYHLYDLQRKTTVKDRQIKQISLLEGKGVPLRKEFIIDNAQSWWFWQAYSEQEENKPVKVVVSFRNSAADRLGMPLPEGIIRLYKQDSAGGAQFVGEDRIKHTPKDEEVRIKVGEAFDVVSQRRQVNFQRISNRTIETSWEIRIRNHKKEDIVVQVIEPIAGYADWQIPQAAYPYTKVNAANIRFEVPVSRDGEAILTYTAQVTR